jgi:heme/copper-type cytochrome/quinol oxidase subunit 2
VENLNQEELEKLEKERQNIYLTIKTLNIIIGILIIAIIFTLLKNTSLLFDQKSFASLFEKQQNATIQIFTPTLKILIISSIALIILISINQRLKKTIKDKISKAIYMPKFKEKDANFDHERGLTYKEVIASKLFPYPNRFESNNLVQGKISGFLYRASNITLWKRERKGKDVEETVIFDGRMYIIRTPFYKKSVILRPKNNKENPLNIAILLAVALSVFAFAIVVMVPKVLSSSIPSLFPSSSNNIQIPEEAINRTSQQNLKFVMILVGVVVALILISLTFNLLFKRKRRYKKAQLESNQFNKYFDIETTDQIELRKTLTPAIMEKIINLRDSIGEFYLSIIGNRVFFAFPRPFNIRYDRPIQELIEEAKESTEREIETIKSIIETLKLEEEKMKKGI